jgi:hypothetical protein
MLLVQNFEEVVKFFGIGVTESDRLTAALERQKKVNEGLFSVQENAITIMKAEGASMKDILDATEKLNAAKIKAAKDDIELQKLKIKEVFLNDSITESLQRTAASVLRAQGNSRDADKLDAKINADKLKRASEFGDQIRTDLITISKLETENRIASIEGDKAKNEQYKKHLEEQNKIRQDNEKLISENTIAGAQIDKDNRKLIADDISAEESEKLKLAKEKDDAEYAALLERIAKKKQTAEDEKLIAAELEKYKYDVSKQSLTAIQNLSDTFFAIKMANVRKGSKEEEDLARKQFNINKGIQISLAIISGVQGVLNALSAKSILPEPFATGVRIANAIAVGTASIAAVAKISSTQFQSAGGGGAPSISAGSSTSSPSMPSGNGTPSIAAPTQNTTTFTGNNNNNFNQPPIKTYVVETDLRNSTNTIDKIKDQATF